MRVRENEGTGERRYGRTKVRVNEGMGECGNGNKN